MSCNTHLARIMSPSRKANVASKISAKRPRASGKDPMELLEEGLYKVNISRAMDLDAPQSEEDVMAIDLATMFVVFAGIAALIPPPCALIRSTNSASLLPPNPHPLV